MNSLSWLLYAAEVTDTLKGLSGSVLIAGVLLAVFGGIFGPLVLMDGDIELLPGTLRAVGRAACIVLSVAAVVWVVAPSKQTLMLIAASEVGESVLASPEAQQIGGEAGALAKDSLSVLRKFINEQLAEPAPTPAK